MTKQTWDPHSVPVVLCESTETALDELRNLRHADAVAVDTETEILRDEEGNPINVDFDVDGPGPWRVMSIAAKFGHGDNAYIKAWVLDMKYVDAAALADIFKGIRPWGWNVNFDRFVLACGGLRIRKWWDGMIFDAVLKQGAYYATGARPWYTSLENAGAKYLGVTKIDGKTDTRYEYTMATEHLTEAEVRYAADDALVTLWCGEVLIVETKKFDLYETAVRGCDAQAFIDSMAKNGLSLDRESYQGRIDEARAAKDAAAERIAVATTGKELLNTVVKWAEKQDETGIQQLLSQHAGDQVEAGLAILKDERIFGAFLTALREQLAVCREQMSRLTGAEGPTEDLFSNDARWVVPFEPDDEVSVKKWITKTLPQFTAAHIAATGIGTRQLIKAHDLTDVLVAMIDSSSEDVLPEYKQLAVVLASYLRYARIVATYGGVVGEVWLKPDWNTNSGEQVKAMLNQFSPAEVEAYTRTKDGSPHPLGKSDSVDSDALSLIGGELSKALLDFRKHEKTVSTYGDEWLNAIHALTGRVHGKYTQDLTGTGRLSSFSPNMQNASIIKPYAFPKKGVKGEVLRVLVCADLSQAELRFVAHMSQDINMLTAFRSGEDLHERTASLMFSIDMKTLKLNGDKPLSELTAIQGVAKYAAEDPEMKGAALYKKQRSKAKAVAFGYAYGLKGASLSKQLTVQGVPTTKEEADELLRKFDEAYPQLAAWMAKRVAFIDSLSGQMKDVRQDSGVDFEASWRLHRLYAKANSTSKVLRNKLGRKASAFEVAEEIQPTAALRLKLAAGKVTGQKVAAVEGAFRALAESPESGDAELVAGFVAAGLVPDEQVGASLLEFAKSLRSQLPAEFAVSTESVTELLVSQVVTDDMVAEARKVQAENIEWALGHYGSTVLATDGTPWSFESRTLGNRRRLFQIGTKDWVFAMVSTIATSRKQHAIALRDAWVSAYNAEVTAAHEAGVASGKIKGNTKVKTVALSKVDPNTGRTKSLNREELEKAFEGAEGSAMAASFVQFVLNSYEETLGNKAAGAKEYLYRFAMADRIRAMGNQYRNHPIQGGVADAVLEAYGEIDDVLIDQFPTAQAVQTVHDSIVVECDLADAKAVRDAVVAHMEECLRRYCPTVPCRADGDVQLSLDDKTIIEDEKIDELLSELAVAA